MALEDADKVVNKADKLVAARYRQIYHDTRKELDKLYDKMGEPSLENAAKFDRLNKLKTELEKEYKKMTGQNITLSRQTSTETFKQGALDFQQAMPPGINFGKLPTDAIRNSILSEISGQTYIKTFQVNAADNLAKVESAITRGLFNGDSVQTVARSVQDMFERGYNDAIRVVRTEALRNYSAGTLYEEERARKAGIEFKKVWITEIDGRERESHRVLNETEADEEGYFDTEVGKIQGPRLSGVASFDINCRCTTVMDVNDDDNPAIQAASGEGPKVESIPATFGLNIDKMMSIKLPKNIKSAGIDSPEYKKWIWENWH